MMVNTVDSLLNGKRSNQMHNLKARSQQMKSANDFDRIWQGQTGKQMGKHLMSKTDQRSVSAQKNASAKADAGGRGQTRRKGNEQLTQKAETKRSVSREEENRTPNEPSQEVMELLGSSLVQLIQQIAEVVEMTPEQVQGVMSDLEIQPMELLERDGMSQLLLQLTDEQDFAQFLTDEGLYDKLQSVLTMQNRLFQQVESSLETAGSSLTVQEAFAAFSESLSMSNLSQEDSAQADSTDAGGSDHDVTNLVDSDDERTKSLAEHENFHAKNNREKSSHSSQNGDPYSFQQTVQWQGTQTDESLAVADVSTEWSPDTRNIMKQIMDYMRLQVKPDLSNLQMQLHPASLGTLQIQLASRGGVVTAQFFTQNETVKAVLESQMIQLQESFAEQGIKVEAIEVAVQTHQFERNLDQGENRQNQDGAAKQKRNRRVELSEAVNGDDSVALVQDETVQKEMALANGNLIDFSA